jgi:hypothetical protein
MRSVIGAAAAAVACCSVFAAGAAAQTYHGQPVDPSRYGPSRIESLEQVLTRDAARAGDEPINPRARRGRHGEWTIPSPKATLYPCSGNHCVVNEWGDTRMAIGLRRPAHVHGAFVGGQGGEGAWARAVRVHGFRHGQLVQSTPWLADLTAQPQWLEMNLFDVDRIEIEARPAFGNSGWYSLDDLSWTALDDPQAALRIVTFDDRAYGEKLTATGYAGLDWEPGLGPVDLGEGVPAPQIRPQTQPTGEKDTPQAAGGLPNGGTDGGTPPELILGFQGVLRGDAGSLTYPPDSCGAIGPTHFVEVVNRNFAIYDRTSGQELANVLLGSFLPGATGDPRVLYDQGTDRWFVMATDFADEEKIFLAVSLGSDPTGDWFKTEFEADLGSDIGCWPDYPTLGVDSGGIHVAVFMISCGMTIFAIDKAPLLEAEPLLGAVTAFRDLPFEGSIQPVHTYGSAPGEYFISRQSATQLRIRRLEGPPDNPVLVEAGGIDIPVHSEAADVPALGSLTPLDSVDARLINAVYRDGSIWTAHTVEQDGRAACRWYEVDARSLSLVEWGTIADPVVHYFFPGIAVNAAHDVVMGFSGSSPDQYVGAYCTGRSVLDPPGEMAPPVLLQAGLAPQNNIDAFGRNRWGDYSLTSLDPVDEFTLWTIQEYAHDEDIWGTWIGALAPQVPCDNLAFCADSDQNAIRDDSCVWWACTGFCLDIDIPFADMGGANGDCVPDGTADVNDRFHALNCFSDQNTFGLPGYPCESAPPQALNVDAGGPSSSCEPDGVCDANDAFHALNAFTGETTCSCPAGPSPASGGGLPPQPPGSKPLVQNVRIVLSAARGDVRPGSLIEVEATLAAPLQDLRGYQLHVSASGGVAGRLELVDIRVADSGTRRSAPHSAAKERNALPGTWNSQLPLWSAFNLRTQQLAAGLDGAGVAAPAGAHLATFVYRASADAAGRFIVELLHDPADRTQRTYFFATRSSAAFHIDSRAAIVDVAASPARTSRTP